MFRRFKSYFPGYISWHENAFLGLSGNKLCIAKGFHKIWVIHCSRYRGLANSFLAQLSLKFIGYFMDRVKRMHSAVTKLFLLLYIYTFNFIDSFLEAVLGLCSCVGWFIFLLYFLQLQQAGAALQLWCTVLITVCFSCPPEHRLWQAQASELLHLGLVVGCSL